MEEEKWFGDAASPEVRMEECMPGNSAGGNSEMANKVVFCREAPLISREPGTLWSGCSCSSKRLERGSSKNDKIIQEKRLSRQDRIELCRLFQGAVSSHDWDLAESLILLADAPTLNDELCIALDSIWFLRTRQELDGITGLIKKIISNGAYDFARAAMRTSFLASCVSACQRPNMSLVDTVAVMDQRHASLPISHLINHYFG